MPNASLAMLTSPILIGAIPPAQLDEIAARPAVPLEASAMPQRRGSDLIPLGWSLTQAQGSTSTSGEPGTQRQPAEPQEEGADEQGEDNQIIVEGQVGPPESDPMVAVNETSYRITQAVDSAFVEPLAYGYRDGLPEPVRDGLGNVVRNLSEPTNFINFLLQFKIGDAFETLGRFAINSTIGVGGLFDVAGGDAIGLPYRRNGFANTMGYYGIGSGSYLYLPLTGATSVRDVIGSALDQAVLPIGVGKPFNTPEYGIPVFIVSNLEARLEVDEELARIEDTIDPYAARRDTYLARREREIAELRGDPIPPKPRILQEIDGDIEPGDPLLEEQELEDTEAHGEAGNDNSQDEATDPTLLSAISPRELPSLAATVMITRPRTR